MGCPVHIWVPMMAAVAPAATVARHKLRSVLPGRKPDSNPADHIDEMRRWTAAAAPTSDQAAK